MLLRISAMSLFNHRASYCLAALTLFAAAACTDSTDSDSPWSSSVTSIEISSAGGGFRPPAPTGSQCESGSAAYSLSLVTSQLSAWQCQGNGTAPYQKATRDRALTQAEMSALLPVLKTLQLDTERRCVGADKAAIDLKITDARGTVAYRDGFYGCGTDPRPPVDTAALGNVFGKLALLAFPATL
jgi:hypothetical protein